MVDILWLVWYHQLEVRAMLIDSVVQREAVRNEQMILQYESLIGELPKGSITCRKTDITISDTAKTASCMTGTLARAQRRSMQSAKNSLSENTMWKCSPH